MAAGRQLILFNTRGEARYCELRLADSKRAEVLIGGVEAPGADSGLEIELGIGLSKGDRFDFVVQKATELGVARIQPLQTERVETRLNPERMSRKLDHWRSVAISACEQSGRNCLPAIEAPIQAADWIVSVSSDVRLVLTPNATAALADARGKPGSVSVYAGPEGGLTGQEIEAASGCGFMPVSLGPRTLRTETAPLAAISIVQALWGDFQGT